MFGDYEIVKRTKNSRLTGIPKEIQEYANHCDLKISGSDRLYIEKNHPDDYREFMDLMFASENYESYHQKLTKKDSLFLAKFTNNFHRIPRITNKNNSHSNMRGSVKTSRGTKLVKRIKRSRFTGISKEIQEYGWTKGFNFSGGDISHIENEHKKDFKRFIDFIYNPSKKNDDYYEKLTKKDFFFLDKIYKK